MPFILLASTEHVTKDFSKSTGVKLKFVSRLASKLVVYSGLINILKPIVAVFIPAL